MYFILLLIPATLTLHFPSDFQGDLVLLDFATPKQLFGQTLKFNKMFSQKILDPPFKANIQEDEARKNDGRIRIMKKRNFFKKEWPQ